jgi:hypothetical protein
MLIKCAKCGKELGYVPIELSIVLCQECEVEINTCPVCMDAPKAEGQGACNACLCDLYADDIRSIRFAMDLDDLSLEKGDDEYPGEYDEKTARVADLDIPF